jgi:hypothetical protein
MVRVIMVIFRDYLSHQPVLSSCMHLNARMGLLSIDQLHSHVSGSAYKVEKEGLSKIPKNSSFSIVFTS